MRFLYLLTAALILFTGCTSSSQNKTLQELPADLIKLQQPGDTPHQPSKVYVDSVTQVIVEQQPVLLISGTFPDACTKLKEATHATEGNTVSLDLKAWRNPDVMCAQVLTSFSFIYDKLSQDKLSSHSEVTINGTVYSY